MKVVFLVTEEETSDNVVCDLTICCNPCSHMMFSIDFPSFLIVEVGFSLKNLILQLNRLATVTLKGICGWRGRQFDSPLLPNSCGFSKKVSSKDRLNPVFFETFKTSEDFL